MKALCNVLSKTLYSLLSTGSTYYRWTGKRRDMTTKMMTATLNINTNKKSTQITKETLISKLFCSCVRLLVHRFIFSMTLGNIRVIFVMDDNSLPNSVYLGKR